MRGSTASYSKCVKAERHSQPMTIQKNERRTWLLSFSAVNVKVIVTLLSVEGIAIE